ncbi:PDZ domain-containing protein [Candidatus Dojkabacteria bacterium]|nr:PDZ domain-containing protein [Candidatus Dojkabacteria bacterium]
MVKAKVSSINANKDVSSLSINRFLNFIGLVLVIFCVFTVGFFSGKVWGGSKSNDVSNLYKIVGKTENNDVTELDFDRFWEVWETLATQYVDKDLDQQEMYYGAIKGMVDGLDDPATVYLTPEETQQYKDGNQGKFEGIGAEMGYEDGYVVIISPLEGSPAIEAGLKSGDKVLKVDGNDVTGKGLYEVVALLRGEKGTDVEITVLHKDGSETEDIVVTRDEIKAPSITFEGMEGDIAVVDVDRFTESSLVAWEQKWDSVIEDVKKEKPKALVIDLRGNPGGYFSAAVWAAGDFLDSGTVVVKQEDREGDQTSFTVDRDGNMLDIPVVVLVNGGSASASEIFAGAMQQNDRAYIIGEETYGKGTAQDIVDFTDGSSLHITIFKWLLPDGTWLNPDNVIEPDKKIDISDQEFKDGDDPQMDEALKYLNSKI